MADDDTWDDWPEAEELDEEAQRALWRETLADEDYHISAELGE